MKKEKALKQLRALDKLAPKKMRLAAEWRKPWQILISTILSSQTRDETTIDISNKLYKKYSIAKKLGDAPLSSIKSIIKPVNFYKTKAKNIKATAKIISKQGIPTKIDDLLKLPGVGRKVGNVYLASAKNENVIGIDTHCSRIAQKLDWTKNKHPYKIEKDLERLFPKSYWRSINYILVRFGRSHTRKQEDDIFKKIRKL